MLLKNKKTGEIVKFHYLQTDYISPLVLTIMRNGKPVMNKYNSLTELNEEWEDVLEEPKKHYEILAMGVVMEREDAEDEIFRNQGQREIGNYFLSREEAEKAVEKLKAITRLKKCGFKFEGYADIDRANGGDIVIYAHVDIPNNNLLEEAQPDMLKDLDLIFGGEE
jgi:hypothetical protein